MTETAFLIMENVINPTVLEHLGVGQLDTITLGADGALDEPIACVQLGRELLDQLGVYGYDITRVVDSGVEGLQFVGLANPDGSPANAESDPRLMRTVTVTNWYGAHDVRDFLKEVAQRTVAYEWNRNVEICDHGGRTSNPVDGDLLQVHVFSSPTRGAYILRNQFWGVQLNYQLVCDFNVWLEGTPIYSEEGYEVGAFKGNDLYIYPNLNAQTGASDQEHAQKIFEKILTEAARLHGGGEPTMTPETVRARFLTCCAARADARERELRDQLTRSEENVANYRKRLVEAARAERQAVEELGTVDKLRENLHSQLTNEYNAICNMPRVVSVDWRGDCLTVETEMLHCINPDTGFEHELGCFQFMIDQASAEVRIFNKTRQVNSFSDSMMHAPHVFPGGRLCLGNQADTLPPAVANYEWTIAVVLCFAFVESVNFYEDAAGRGVTCWPVARTATEVEEDAERRTGDQLLTDAQARDLDPAGAAAAHRANSPDLEDEDEEDDDEDYDDEEDDI